MHGQTLFFIFPEDEEEKARVTAILHDYLPSATLADEGKHLLYRTFYPTSRAKLEIELGCHVSVRRHLADLTSGQPVGGAAYNLRML